MNSYEPEHDVEYFEPPRREPTKRERKLAEAEMRYEEAVAMATEVPSFYTRAQVKKADRARRAARLPLPARIAASVVMVAVVLGGFAGCIAATNEGNRYNACIQQIAQTEGHDAAEIAMREGECR